VVAYLAERLKIIDVSCARRYRDRRTSYMHPASLKLSSSGRVLLSCPAPDYKKSDGQLPPPRPLEDVTSQVRRRQILATERVCQRNDFVATESPCCAAALVSGALS